MEIFFAVIGLALCGYQFYEIYSKNKAVQEDGKGAKPVNWYALIPVAAIFLYFLFDEIIDH